MAQEEANVAGKSQRGAREREREAARRAVGTCYGYAICSTLAFEYLRGGTGDPLVVEEVESESLVPCGDPVKIWEPLPAKRSLTKLYREDGTFFVEIGEADRFRIDPHAGRITVSPSREPRRRELRLWTTPAAIHVTLRGDLALHAAAVEIDGRGVLLISPSGLGKSTLAAAFFAQGYGLLADDFACCRVLERPVVFPGPSLLRLSSEVVARLVPPDTYLADEGGAKVHLGIAQSRRGGAEPVELAGIVFLRDGSCAMALEPMPATTALRDLWAMTFHLPGEGEMARCFRNLGDLVARVPVWSLFRDLEWRSLPATVTRIVEKVARNDR